MVGIATIEVSALSCLQLQQPLESGLQSVHVPNNEEEAKGETATVTCGNQVLMQTATTTALNTSGDQSIPVRIILDLGS